MQLLKIKLQKKITEKSFKNKRLPQLTHIRARPKSGDRNPWALNTWQWRYTRLVTLVPPPLRYQRLSASGSNSSCL